MSLIWTNASLEPKRKFRYILSFSGDSATDLKDITFLAQTCDRPGFKIGATEHKYFDKSFWHPGRVVWEPNPLTAKLVDIQKGGGSTSDTSEMLLKVFAKAGLNGVIQTTGQVQTVGKAAASTALGDVTIRVLNSALNELPDAAAGAGGAGGASNPDVLAPATAELWTLKNAWLESIKPEALDYGAEDLLTVTIAIRYDWAEYQPHGATEPVIKFGA